MWWGQGEEVMKSLCSNSSTTFRNLQVRRKLLYLMDTAVINQNTLCNVLYQLLLFSVLVIQSLTKCKFWKFTRLLNALVAWTKKKKAEYPLPHYPLQLFWQKKTYNSTAGRGKCKKEAEGKKYFKHLKIT